MKIGSLFDGSGGFPLAAFMCGGEPVWASEVEPYPIAVTRSRFPMMKHLGDISKINGAEVEPVDIISFGSPCQDLSVAGKRAGLKHTENGDEETTRSGLFMEAVRIIKEMREATNGEYPRYAVWENVPGAFSSNKGEDFRIVLEELVRVAEPSAVMPEVPKAGWAYADVYCGDGWSLAYRVLDAQYWGVPQRRRRIYLVADFRGQRAGKILFEREGLRGNPAESGAQREAVARNAESGIGADDCERAVPYTLKIRSGCAVDSAGKAAGKGALIQENKAATLAVAQDQYLFQPVGFDGYNSALTGENAATLGVNCGMSTGRNGVVYAIDQGGGKSAANVSEDLAPTLTCTHGGEPAVAYSFDSLASNSMKSKNPHSGCRQVEVAKTLDTTDPNPSKKQGGIAIVCKTYDARGNGDGDTASTITGDHENRVTDYTNVVVERQPVYCLQGNGIDRADTAGCNGKGWRENECYTLNTIDRPAVAYLASGKDQVGTLMANIEEHDATGVDCWNATESAETTGALQASSAHNINSNNVVRVRYIVRRLTPTECARLQGFADSWGEIKEKKDFTDEEYRFWLDVRNTHAAINGKAVKEYTKEQMLTWYNKLHTDSAEYKLWGNGIALPCAVYVMQGIAEGFK